MRNAYPADLAGAALRTSIVQDGKLVECFMKRPFFALLVLVLCTASLSLAQDDDAAREAAQRELEEELRQTREECETRRRNVSYDCVNKARNDNIARQSQCDRTTTDAVALNECKRASSDREDSEESACYSRESSTPC